MTMGYYLTDPSEIIAFPSRRIGASNSTAGSQGPLDVERLELAMTTERGKNWVYVQDVRRIPSFSFRVTTAQLAIFAELDNNVNGNSIPFYFVPDIHASPLVSFLVRKEPDFKPKELDLATINGVLTLMYDYTLQLIEEPTGVSVSL